MTVPCPACSITQLPSHSLSCGHMRPQISGNVFVAWLSSYASRKRPSAVNRSQSGILLWSGQWGLAIRDAALRAPAGLDRRLVRFVLSVDLAEILGARTC